MLKCGETYLITFNNMDGRKMLATFLAEGKGIYLFRNINGEFALTKNKVDRNEISLELIEDF